MEHAQTIPRRVRDVSRNGEVWELYEDDVYIGRTVEDLSDGRHEALAAAPAACRKVSSPAHPRGTWPSSLQAWKAVRNSWGADALETMKAEQKLDALLAERGARLITLPPYTLVEDSNGKKIRQRVWQTTDGEVTLHERDGEYEFRAIVGGFSAADGWNRQYDSVQLLRRQAARLEHAAAFIESQRERLEDEAAAAQPPYFTECSKCLRTMTTGSGVSWENDAGETVEVCDPCHQLLQGGDR